jgi:hypothetical protein
VCLLDFYITQILTSTTAIIECISWLIKVTDNNDAQWKPEIDVLDVSLVGISCTMISLYGAGCCKSFCVHCVALK